MDGDAVSCPHATERIERQDLTAVHMFNLSEIPQRYEWRTCLECGRVRQRLNGAEWLGMTMLPPSREIR